MSGRNSVRCIMILDERASASYSTVMNSAGDKTMTERVAIRARYTGGKSIGYRWLAEVGSKILIKAQQHPSAIVVEDTWSSHPDSRVKTSTRVNVDAGLLLVDCCDGVWTAGIVVDGDPKNAIDWKRAEHLGCRDDVRLDSGTGRKHTVRVHTIAVDGKSADYEIET